MGQTVQDAKDKVSQQLVGIHQFLDNSVQLLRSKHQQFLHSIIQSGDSQKEIPVSRFFQKRHQIRVSMKSGSDLGQDVKKIIGQFTNQQYADAVGSILTIGTNALIGSSTGAASQKRGYLISVGSQGSIMRIDYMIYLKEVTSKTLVNIAQNFYLCSYAISSVKTDNLTIQDLFAAVSIAYKDASHQSQKQLLQILKKNYLKSK